MEVKGYGGERGWGKGRENQIGECKVNCRTFE